MRWQSGQSGLSGEEIPNCTAGYLGWKVLFAVWEVRSQSEASSELKLNINTVLMSCGESFQFAPNTVLGSGDCRESWSVNCSTQIQNTLTHFPLTQVFKYSRHGSGAEPSSMDAASCIIRSLKSSPLHCTARENNCFHLPANDRWLNLEKYKEQIIFSQLNWTTYNAYLRCWCCYIGKFCSPPWILEDWDQWHECWM